MLQTWKANLKDRNRAADMKSKSQRQEQCCRHEKQITRIGTMLQTWKYCVCCYCAPCYLYLCCFQYCRAPPPKAKLFCWWKLTFWSSPAPTVKLKGQCHEIFYHFFGSNYSTYSRPHMNGFTNIFVYAKIFDCKVRKAGVRVVNDYVDTQIFL